MSSDELGSSKVHARPLIRRDIRRLFGVNRYSTASHQYHRRLGMVVLSVLV